jgi:hypothetical protein
MRFAKRLLMGVGAVALTAMVLSVAAPKAVHATVAALVQVVNTTANPAVTLDAETSTRIPYQSYQTYNTFSGGFIGFTLTYPTVPAGYRLVIQNVNSLFYEYLSSGETLSDIVPQGNITTAFAPDKAFPSFTGSMSGGAYSTPTALFNSSITRYVGPGDTPYVNMTAVVEPSQIIGVTVTGYLENCAVTGCPAPVH